MPSRNEIIEKWNGLHPWDREIWLAEAVLGWRRYKFAESVVDQDLAWLDDPEDRHGPRGTRPGAVVEAPPGTPLYTDGGRNVPHYTTDPVVHELLYRVGKSHTVRISNKSATLGYWWCYVDDEVAQAKTIGEAVGLASLLAVAQDLPTPEDPLDPLEVLRDLVEWGDYTGGWDAQCWSDARKVLEQHRKRRT